MSRQTDPSRLSLTVALSRLVNGLKGVSSRRLRQEFPELARHHRRANSCVPS
jgi:REP element-mobilizing transposase RayT